MNKKGDTAIGIRTLMVAVLIIGIGLVVWLITGGGIGKSADFFEGQFAFLKDCDGDGKKGSDDKCPCKKGDEDNEKFPGCPSGVDTKEKVNEHNEEHCGENEYREKCAEKEKDEEEE